MSLNLLNVFQMFTTFVHDKVGLDLKKGLTTSSIASYIFFYLQ